MNGLIPALLPPAFAAGEALGVAAALGALAFPGSALSPKMAARQRALAGGGLLLHLASVLGRLGVSLAGAETESPPLGALAADLAFLLLQTRFGTFLAADLGASLLALAALAWEKRPAALLLALGAALALAFTGHAAALGGGAGLAGGGLAFAHIAAGGLWLGELPLLFLLLRERGAAALPALRLFSRRALFMVAGVAGAGIFLGLSLAGPLPALWHDAYGRLILAKTALFAALLGLAAENRLILLPRLARGGRGAVAKLRRNVGLAVILGLALLILAGLLAATGPPAGADVAG